MPTAKINIRIDDALLVRLKEAIKASGTHKKSFVSNIISSFIDRESRKRNLLTITGYNKKACYVVTVDEHLYVDIKKMAEIFEVTMSDIVRYALIDYDIVHKK